MDRTWKNTCSVFALAWRTLVVLAMASTWACSTQPEVVATNPTPKDDNTRYRLECEAGVAHGCTNLGLAYDRGTGVERDLVKANALYAKACARDEMEACTSLGCTTPWHTLGWSHRLPQPH